MNKTNNSFDAAIIDYGLGNLFSVRNACAKVGLTATVTSDKETIRSARMVILPGVGAFGDAMAALTSSGIDEVLRDVVAEGKILFCICLGLQLLMTESQEFGRHRGLNIVEGEVIELNRTKSDGTSIKVPHVGWNRIYDSPEGDQDPASWRHTPLAGIRNNEAMYFVHSFYVKPRDSKVVLAKTKYGEQEFCSALIYKNIFACQFHPEKSALEGIKIYENLAKK